MMSLAHRHMASQRKEGVGLGARGSFQKCQPPLAFSDQTSTRPMPGSRLLCWDLGVDGETGPLSHTPGDGVVMREKQRRAEGECGQCRLWRRDGALVTGASGSAPRHQEPG